MKILKNMKKNLDEFVTVAHTQYSVKTVQGAEFGIKFFGIYKVWTYWFLLGLMFYEIITWNLLGLMFTWLAWHMHTMANQLWWRFVNMEESINRLIEIKKLEDDYNRHK